jgi:hypothetical protein
MALGRQSHAIKRRSPQAQDRRQLFSLRQQRWRRHCRRPGKRQSKPPHLSHSRNKSRQFRHPRRRSSRRANSVRRIASMGATTSPAHSSQYRRLRSHPSFLAHRPVNFLQRAMSASCRFLSTRKDGCSMWPRKESQRFRRHSSRLHATPSGQPFFRQGN